MSKVSISEAARLTGKSRITLHRHIEKGKLSKEVDGTGRPIIDVSELERVYGRLQQPNTPSGATGKQAVTANASSLLQAENVLLREQVTAIETERQRERHQHEATIDDLRRRLDVEGEERRKLMALLTDQRRPEPAVIAPEKPAQGRLSRAWSILRGKA